MSAAGEQRDSIVDFILELFATRGAAEYMGEAVSMSQHMEQSAACARADNAPDSLVIAALVHFWLAPRPEPIREAMVTNATI